MEKILFVIGVLLLNVWGAKGQVEPVKIFEEDENTKFRVTGHFTDDKLAYCRKWNDKNFEITLFDADLNPSRTVIFEDVLVPDINMVEGTTYNNRLLMSITDCFDRYGVLEEYHYFTQTLFNDDDQLEALVVVYNTLTKKDGESFIQVHTIVRFDIISEDNEVLGSFLPPNEMKTVSYIDDYFMEYFYFGDNKYLVFREGKGYDDSMAVIYRIDNSNPNNVMLHKVVTSAASPNPIRRDETLTIKLKDEIKTSDSYVQITDMSGKIVLRQAIGVNMTEIKVPAHRLSSGQCVYTVVSGGKTVDSGKVICR